MSIKGVDKARSSPMTSLSLSSASHPCREESENSFQITFFALPHFLLTEFRSSHPAIMHF